MQHLIAGAHCWKRSADCLNSTFVDASRTVQKILVDGGLTASSILKSPNECQITSNCLE